MLDCGFEVHPRRIQPPEPVRRDAEDVRALDPEDVVSVAFRADAQLLSCGERVCEVAAREAGQRKRPDDRCVGLAAEFPSERDSALEHAREPLREVVLDRDERRRERRQQLELQRGALAIGGQPISQRECAL